MPTERKPEGTNTQVGPVQTPGMPASGMRMSGMQVTPRGRFWAVHDHRGQLVCVTVYKKGAREVVRRLSSASRKKRLSNGPPRKASAPTRPSAASPRKRLPRSRYVPTRDATARDAAETASAQKG